MQPGVADYLSNLMGLIMTTNGLPPIEIPTDPQQVGFYLYMIKKQGDDTAKKLDEMEKKFAMKPELANMEARVAKLENGNSWIVRMGTQVGLTGVISAAVAFVMKFISP